MNSCRLRVGKMGWLMDDETVKMKAISFMAAECVGRGRQLMARYGRGLMPDAHARSLSSAAVTVMVSDTRHAPSAPTSTLSIERRRA